MSFYGGQVMNSQRYLYVSFNAATSDLPSPRLINFSTLTLEQRLSQQRLRQQLGQRARVHFAHVLAASIR